ncbi:alanine--tRNA ligase [Dorea formicigenerans]|uniref:alanine--tRNA ligase n=2 Tax=Bacteria TaxID=2 RepID=UPI00156FCBA6|nr:alanine--tRNA ligase [Dorea formicigenerans]NSC61714.1 alanine--tRNA ligase [Dorea formicigenerans]
MQKYGVNELRRMFLEFFESKDHLALKSFSLVPHNDKSLLLINSGMAPMKPYFTGQEIPPRRRVTTCQKCIRTGDIENVGKTARHGTFFEMLGNFSFGDYFKTEAIHWTWEFLTEVVGLDPERLYPSVYENDDEAWEIWNKEIGVPEERIFRFGKEDNFWEHGSGPCGPCSEVYYDRGEKYGCGKPGCTVGCECDRYMEIWNDVFSQFNNDGHGNYSDLAQKNIDTGMGLERLACVVQDVDSMFDIDTMKALRDHVCAMSGKHYGIDHETDVSLRVVTDHIRSVTFMISDGIMPSNSGRGYVLRRLLRRACRHGRLLGIEGAFLVELAQTVIDGSKDGYPELEEKKDFIFNVIAKEEAQFNKTIDQGLSILADMEEEMKKNGETVLSGENAFKLYDTYGFPIDLTSEILEEKGLTYDKEGFEKAQKEQRAKSEGTFGTHSYTGKDATVYDELEAELATEFVGYENLVCDAKVTALTSEEEIVDALSDGEKGTIIVDKTTFYGTMGGQEGDIGTIKTADGEFVVENTIHLAGTKIGHVGYVSHGMIKVGDAVSMEVDKENRNLSARNHSATHLLQAALRQVLGTHVEQAGSYVDAERLRFDFTHFSALSKEELKQVENIVNEKIAECLPVVAKNMPIEEARKTGAAALFGEKYGDVVRVVSMGDFSVEFCGGTHVSNTGVISALKIISETGVAAGVRRIEALTSKGLLKYYDDMEKKLQEAASLVKATPNQLSDKIRHLQAENKDLHSELESVKSKMAKEAMGDVSDQVTEVKGVKLIAAKVDDVDMNGLRDLGDQLKEKLGEGVIVLASAAGGKVSLVAMATDEAVKKGAHAGNLIKGIAGLVGGGGGGRPNMAQAGGKNPDGIDAAIAKVSEVLESQL